MKQNWKRLVCVSALSLGVLAGGMPNVEAHSFLEGLGKKLYAGLQKHQELNNLDDSEAGQQKMLKELQEETGVYNNYAYQVRAQRIIKELSKSPKVKRSYTVYVTPEKDINAFMALGRVMAINKGTMDLMDDDALASIVGHEIGHGEHKDT